MNELNFITPTQCLVKQIEKNEKLNNICKQINQILETNFSLNGQVSAIVDYDTNMLWDEIYLLKSIYKRFGWKLANIQQKSDDLNEKTVGKFLITEAS